MSINPFPRPAELTVEYVITYLDRAIRGAIFKSRATRPADPSPDDIYNDIILELITPSENLGTSYLQRYDPATAYASTYVMTVVHNHLKRLYKRETAVVEHLGVAFGLDEEANVDDEPLTFGDIIADENDTTVQMERRLTQQEIMKLISRPEYAKYTSTSSKGVPRSTARVAALLMLKQMDVEEIAVELEVSPAEVYRRLRSLRKDTRFRQFQAA